MSAPKTKPCANRMSYVTSFAGSDCAGYGQGLLALKGGGVHFGHRWFARALVIESSHFILSPLRFLLSMGLYMFVTEEEAAEIYAKACRSWYRDEAKAVVNSKILVLKAKGDGKGVKAWTQVRRSLERQERSLN
jgi:hypothetical protein